jgi:hypothetical protein
MVMTCAELHDEVMSMLHISVSSLAYMTPKV